MLKLVLLAVLAVSTAAAQSDWANVKALPIGQEIRLSLKDGSSYRGQVQSVTDDSLIIVAAASQQTLARAQIKMIATKREGHRLRDTLIGAAAGGGIALGIGAIEDSHCSQCIGPKNLGKVLYPPVGAIAGAVIGVAWPTGGWHNVYKSAP